MCEVFVQTLKDENKCYIEMYRQILRTNKIYNRGGRTKQKVPILVKFFVEKMGLNISKIDGAFYQACAHDNFEMVKYFIDCGVDDWKQQGFLVALAMGNFDIVKFLVDNNYVQYQQQNEYMLSACSSGNLQMVKYLEEKYFMNVLNQKYFKLACLSNHIELVKYIVEKGYDVSSEESYSLRVSSSYGNYELVRYFVENGAKISDCNYNSIIKSSQYGYIEIVKYLLECESVDVIIPQEVINMAFYYACVNGRLNVAEYLESKGATYEKVEYVCLKQICQRQYFKIIELLYEMNYFDEHKEEEYMWIIERYFNKQHQDKLKYSKRVRFLRLITAFSEY